MGDPRQAGRWVLAKAAWAGTDFPSLLPNTWWLRNAEGPKGGEHPQQPLLMVLTSKGKLWLV